MVVMEVSQLSAHKLKLTPSSSCASLLCKLLSLLATMRHNAAIMSECSIWRVATWSQPYMFTTSRLLRMVRSASWGGMRAAAMCCCALQGASHTYTASGCANSAGRAGSLANL